MTGTYVPYIHRKREKNRFFGRICRNGRQRISLMKIGALLLITVGFLFGMIPLISHLFSHLNHTELVRGYQKALDDCSQQELDRLWTEAEEYNAKLFSRIRGEENAFSVSMEELDREYPDLLNPGGDGVMCCLEIPAIHVNLPVYHGTAETVLARGAGHLQNSSLPVGGANTHTVIAAHTGLPQASLFDDLVRLREGDRIILHTLKRELDYQVVSVEIVEPTAFGPLQIREGEDLVTLLTCYPYGINTHRLYVHACRKELKDEPANEYKEANRDR